jgi:hypothetical protein
VANERASEPTRAARHDCAKKDASERSEVSHAKRSEPAKRLARERVGESEGQSPSD